MEETMLPPFCGRNDECPTLHRCHEERDCLHPPERTPIESPDQIELELDGYWVTKNRK